MNQPANASVAVSPSQPPVERRWTTALMLVAAVALTLRLVYLWQLYQSPLAQLLIGDARAYDQWARQLAAGDWIGSGVFYQAPLYPYFLGVIYALLGHDLAIVRLVQAALGAAGCVLLAMAGRSLVDRRVGLVAGLMLAMYPPAIFFDGLIQKSALDLPLLCLALWLLARGRETAVMHWWWQAGMALAMLMLSRENALVFIVAAAAWALWPDAGVTHWRRRTLRSVALLLGLVIILSPVAARNWVVGGEFHLTTSQFGPNFYIGNHAAANGSYQPLRYGRGDAAYERQDAIDLAQEASGRPLSPSEVSTYWTGQALSFITHQPMDYLKLLIRKTMLTFNHVELSDTEGQYAYGDYIGLLRSLEWLGFGIILPLAAAGMVLGARQFRQMWLVPLCIGLYAVSVIAFYVFARYRLPLAPLLMIYAAMGLVMLPGVWQRGEARRVQAALGAMLLGVVIAYWPMLQKDSQRGTSYANFAAATLAQEPTHLQQADAFYRKAIALAPHYAGAYYNRGVLLLKMGKPAQAAAMLGRAVELQPDSADAWNQLGLAVGGQSSGSPQAMSAYRQAVKLRPGFAAAHNNLGMCLAAQHQLAQAEAEYRIAIAQDPAMAQAHNNLGTTLARQGKLEQAITSFETALKYQRDYPDAQANLAKARQMVK